MSSDASERGPLGRAWAGWQRFWFTPADPTPLCLMRIVVGLLVLYVHIAYTFDLHDFFGPDGWYGTVQADRERREWPNFVPQSTWETEPRFRMPQIAEQRRALRAFIDNIANDRAKQPQVLDLLRNYLPADTGARSEVLNFLKNLPIDYADRDAELRRLAKVGAETSKTDGKSAGKNDPPLPGPLLAMPPQDRERFRTDAHDFLDLLPDDRSLRNLACAVLQLYGPREVVVLADMIDANGPPTRHPKLPTDQARRQEYLDYCERWTCPPDDPDVVVKGHAAYSPFFHVTNWHAINLVHALHLLAIVLFTIGFCTRVTGVLTWVSALAYIHRNPIILFGQDTMMNLCLIYLILSPCGATWSVDWLIARFRAGRTALREGRRSADSSPPKLISAGFAIRLLQVQYCLMYLSAGLAKLKGESWWNGTATWLTMTNPEFSPLHIGAFRAFIVWLCQDQHRLVWELYMNATVAFTLILEIGFPFLVWTRLRPIVIAGAILLHFGIALNMGLIGFTLFMYALLLAWMTPEAVRRVFARPPEKLDKVQFRYDPANPRELTKAARAYALDVWGRVEFMEARDPDESERKRPGQKPVASR